MIQEHLPLITGKGSYIDDINPKNVVYLHVIRSPIARGIIKSVSKPESALLSLTWEDVKLYMPARLFPDLAKTAQVAKMPVLADGRINFVGQPILAFVVEDRYKTEDVAEEVSIDYDELTPIVDPEESLNKEPIHPGLKSNVSIDQYLEGGNLSLKNKADVIVRRKIKQHRIVSNPMEPKGFICWWENDVLNVYVSTQAPFGVKNDLREVLGISPEKIKVYSAPNVGGGFGNKSGGYPEYVLAAIASLKLGRPVKWIETRNEMLVNTQSLGRGEVSDMKLYATKDGEILGIEGTIIANIGAFDYGIGFIAPLFIARLSNGPYKMKFASIRALGVFTNTPPMGFYRGAGRPEAALIHETLVEDLAEELGMDSVEIRRKNLIGDNGYVTPLGVRIDPAGYNEVLDIAEKYYRKAKEVYKDKGVSIVTFAEIVRTSPGEGARVKIENGKVRFYLGLGPHGQAYGSTFRKLASEVLGTSEDKIEIITGSSEIVKEGIGSFGSRAGTIGGSAVVAAATELLKKINANSLSEVDLVKYEGVEAEVFYKVDDIFAPGAHVAVVDVDKETGFIKVLEYYAVDDVGRVMNKEEIEGQIVGGVLQGMSQVMIEAMRYDERGIPLCSSIADCGVPTALEAPLKVNTEYVEYPSQLLSKSRGVGEAGTTGALPAVFIAVEKATKRKFDRTPIDPWLISSSIA
ncbi:xanthine dehydrogenase family protein molybdopterin-binding subunit [Sulfolobus sp. E11-6]|uniref:xanthine dehydrogenase family protein molybdopterin-binding subunit n=1 Tax=Sulfolobus sp. E11-6 TaxID=2663020 RepID=UPI001295776C|nr:xanthine dehydrogenase family protein molybdopterin-binding subunit [Sulfolobus sp. E11-6]QGA68629.1 molybdopterin-dependent oxidoreductase [Sulfolobus sp. E11-6]